jgi:hypothetical protein
LTISQFYFGGFGNQPLEAGEVKQYRDVFRLPGLPLYSVATDRFTKVMLEHNLPPLRFGRLRWGQHHLGYIDASWFVQGLLTGTPGKASAWGNVGAQVNFAFKHWHNLVSTLSVGVAQAWHSAGTSRGWFVSFKFLKS